MTNLRELLVKAANLGLMIGRPNGSDLQLTPEQLEARQRECEKAIEPLLAEITLSEPQFTVSELHWIRCACVVTVYPQVRPLMTQKLGMEEGYLGGVGLAAAGNSISNKIIDLIMQARKQ